jgi:hypothetical protein
VPQPPGERTAPPPRAASAPPAATPAALEDEGDEFLDFPLGEDDLAPSPERAGPAAGDAGGEDELLDVADSLFDDGADAPELTEPEAGLLDGGTPDGSLFDDSGVDLSDAGGDERPKKG